MVAVVAMADLEDSDTQKFTRVGNLLARYLQEELPYIFDLSFGRKFPSAVWCGLWDILIMMILKLLKT